MKKENFDLLLESVREAGRISRGEIQPSRTFVVEKKEDVQYVRSQFRLSQAEFAHVIGVSVNTLQNWEQGRRRPTGAARVLLTIAERRPELFAEALRQDFPALARA